MVPPPADRIASIWGVEESNPINSVKCPSVQCVALQHISVAHLRIVWGWFGRCFEGAKIVIS